MLVLLAAHLSSDARVKHLPADPSAPRERGLRVSTACGRRARWLKDFRNLGTCQRCKAKRAGD